MSVALVKTEKGEPTRALPHLSHSRIDRYLLCPEQYRLYYIEGLRPKAQAAALAFGKVLHQALAHLFQTGGDPVAFFEAAWAQLRDVPLKYGKRGSWGDLGASGAQLLAKFMKEELSRFKNVRGIEQPFTLTVTNLDLPLVGVIDLVADVWGKRTVVDFKSAASSYEARTVALSDQLTAYQLAEPGAEQVALCVFVKTAAPRIEWHRSKRSPTHLKEYLAKVEIVGAEIAASHFYKRPGWWCGLCDYLPVCLGDRKKVRETLVPATDGA